LVVISAGLFFWWRQHTPVDTGQVAAFLDAKVAGGRVHFSEIRASATPLENGDLQIAIEGSAETVVPLFSKEDASDYLQHALGLDPELTAEARRLANDKDASQKPEFARLRPFPPDPYRATILQLTGKSGDRFPYRATLTGHRSEANWTFSLISGAYSDSGPVGEPRHAYPEPTFVAGDAGDDARLRVAVNDYRAFAARVSEIERNIEAAHEVAVRVRRDALMVRLAPGTVYSGSTQRSGESQGTPLYLEITAFNPGGAVSAELRNSGGWHYARPFQGTWSADAEYESVLLDLDSPPEDAVRNGGSFLENTQAWNLSLHLDPKGNLGGSGRYFEYHFQYLDLNQVAKLRLSLSAEFDAATRAAAPGMLYQGTAIARSTGASEPILLRFQSLSGNGEGVVASLESPSRSWKRSLAGTIIGNSRRAGGSPIRLTADSSSAVAEAPVDSVLGDHSDLEIHLALDGTSLAGQDDRYTYRLAAADSGDLSRLDAAKASRAERFKSVLKEGIAYDGTIRDDQGSITQARLEIGHVDAEKGTVVASIHSLALLYVFQDFAGTWSASDGSMTITSSGRGNYDFSDNLAVPFFVAPVPRTLRLALGGNAIAGGIKGDSHWSIDFPVGVFLAAPRERAGEGSTVSGPALPQFPEGAGAYALVNGAWKPLPRNNGHVLVEKSHPMTEDEEDGGPLGLVSAGVRRVTEKGLKTPYLSFDGKEPLPECASAPVVILLKGPGAASLSAIELAALSVDKEGHRRVQVLAAPPNPTQFGEQRIAAYVRHVGADAILLTATAALPAGAYALNGDVAYEIAVR
jgi:hypothetical protein